MIPFTLADITAVATEGVVIGFFVLVAAGFVITNVRLDYLSHRVTNENDT